MTMPRREIFPGGASLRCRTCQLSGLIPEEVKEYSFDCRGIGKVTFPGGMIPVDFLKNVSRNIASVEENPDKILIMGTSGEKITLTFPEGTIEE